MMKTTTKTQIFLFFVTLFTLTTAHADGEFPARRKYPAVEVIELEDLNKRFEQVTIVDARSRYEYDTLHIKGAHHVSLASPVFEEKVADLQRKQEKLIVFYCNGRTCQKSYKATTKATNEGVKSVAFDAGILEWTKAHPERAVLLGKTPVKPGQLLSAKKFRDHLLPPGEFAKRIGENTQVIDARDRFQREAVGLFIGREIRVPFDDRDGWKKQVAKAKKTGKTLLIYDAVGKQVRWLQYFLEDQGLESYFFMQKGAKGFYDRMMDEL